MSLWLKSTICWQRLSLQDWVRAHLRSIWTMTTTFPTKARYSSGPLYKAAQYQSSSMIQALASWLSLQRAVFRVLDLSTTQARAALSQLHQVTQQLACSMAVPAFREVWGPTQYAFQTPTIPRVSITSRSSWSRRKKASVESMASWVCHLRPSQTDQVTWKHSTHKGRLMSTKYLSNLTLTTQQTQQTITQILAPQSLQDTLEINGIPNW